MARELTCGHVSRHQENHLVLGQGRGGLRCRVHPLENFQTKNQTETRRKSKGPLMKAEFRERVGLQEGKESNWERVGRTWGLNLLELHLLRPQKKKQLHSNIVGLTL